jgi:hypothetical protein
MLSVVMLSVVMLSVVMLNVVMLSVVILSVVGALTDYICNATPKVTKVKKVTKVTKASTDKCSCSNSCGQFRNKSCGHFLCQFSSCFKGSCNCKYRVVP